MITTIEKLFKIVYGQKEYHNKEGLEGTEGKNILVSSKGEDNGVYGLFEIEPKFKAPFITVPSTGSIGQAFIQNIDCCVDDNCLVLIPKEKLDINILFQIAFQIRMNKWRYKYGRQITPEKLEKQKVIIIDSEFKIIKFEKDISPKNNERKLIQNKDRLQVFKLKELFKVVRGEGSYLEKLDEGKTPVISTQMSDCGVCGFYDITPIFEENCITIGRIMCNPSIQIKKFSTVPDDMFVLTPLENNSKEFLFYVSAIIKLEGWRFNYCRKATKEKLEQLDIPLPIKDGKINYSYMKEVAKNSYGYTEIEN